MDKKSACLSPMVVTGRHVVSGIKVNGFQRFKAQQHGRVAAGCAGIDVDPGGRAHHAVVAGWVEIPGGRVAENGGDGVEVCFIRRGTVPEKIVRRVGGDLLVVAEIAKSRVGQQKIAFWQGERLVQRGIAEVVQQIGEFIGAAVQERREPLQGGFCAVAHPVGEQTGLLHIENTDVRTFLYGSSAEATGNPAFVNVYQPAPATLYLTAKKQLDGRELREGEFHFHLMEGTKIVAEADNDANGQVKFELVYTKTGTHSYKIVEVEGSLGGVTYDTTAYSALTVEVKDDGNGQLVAYIGGEPMSNGATAATGKTITNTYEAKPAQTVVVAQLATVLQPLTLKRARTWLLQAETRRNFLTLKKN